jgi:cytochrome P450
MPSTRKQEFLAKYGHHDHINKFANSKFAELRAAAASNPLLTKENLDKLVNDSDPHVQYRTVSNPNLTNDHFNKLANHAS